MPQQEVDILQFLADANEELNKVRRAEPFLELKKIEEQINNTQDDSPALETQY